MCSLDLTFLLVSLYHCFLPASLWCLTQGPVCVSFRCLWIPQNVIFLKVSRGLEKVENHCSKQLHSVMYRVIPIVSTLLTLHSLRFSGLDKFRGTYFTTTLDRPSFYIILYPVVLLLHIFLPRSFWIQRLPLGNGHNSRMESAG